MSLDTALRRVAQRVLGTFGTDVTIRRVTVASYSPTAGIMTPTTADTVVAGRLEDYTDRQLSETILAGDRKLTIAAADLDFRPLPVDLVLITGTVYSVVRVRSELAQDAAAIYIMQLRR